MAIKEGSVMEGIFAMYCAAYLIDPESGKSDSAIEKFINEQLPKLKNGDDFDDEFDKFWQNEKILALNAICEEEDLDQEQFQGLIDAYLYSERPPLKNDVLECLAERPSVLKARQIGERIADAFCSISFDLYCTLKRASAPLLTNLRSQKGPASGVKR